MKTFVLASLLASLGLGLCLPPAAADDPTDRKAMIERLKKALPPATFPPKLLGYRLHSTLGHPVAGNEFFGAQGMPTGTLRHVHFKSEIVEFATDMPEVLYYACRDKTSGEETGVLIYVREEEAEPAK